MQKPGRPQWISVNEFANIACLSRRQIDRLRRSRPDGFPREYELSSNASPLRRCPRFNLAEVEAWIRSRALF
jgi:predicted DNA-binding transcriptional regulator AlpA